MYLSALTMKHLSFPDFEVSKMELSSLDRMLQIQIEGAWLDVEGGMQLGKGTLFFYGWENLQISRFDPITEKWSIIGGASDEILRDLPDVSFSESITCLYGFGRSSGQWMEWKITRVKMRAEFSKSLQ